MDAQTAPEAFPTLAISPREVKEGVLRPRTLQRGIELYLEYGCLRIPGVLPAAYIARLRDTYVRRNHAYFEDRVFPDALKVGVGGSRSRSMSAARSTSPGSTQIR